MRLPCLLILLPFAALAAPDGAASTPSHDADAASSSDAPVAPETTPKTEPAPAIHPPDAGLALGLMIPGAVLGVAGTGLALYGISLYIPGIQRVTWGHKYSEALGAGWIVVGAGALIAGVGIPLFLIGNGLREERERILSGRASVAFDTRSGTPLLVWSLEY